MNYILLPAPNRLTIFVKVSNDIDNGCYPSRVHLESISRIVNNNNWDVKNIIDNYPNCHVTTYQPYEEGKMYYYIIYGAEEQHISNWKAVLEEASNCIDFDFKIFHAACYTVQRISENLRVFI